MTDSRNESREHLASESKASTDKVTAFEQNNSSAIILQHQDPLSPPILLNQSSSKVLMNRPHHGSMPTAEFGGKDGMLNVASSAELLVVNQIKGETASSKFISDRDDPVTYV